MKLFSIVFLTVVVMSVALSVILNPQGGPSFEDQTIRDWCERDPDVLKWDQNWDPNNKNIVTAFGSKEGLHDHHVERCVADHLHALR